MGTSGDNGPVTDPSGEQSRSGAPAKGAPQVWRARFQALRGVPRLLAMVWHADRALTIWALLLRAVAAFVPVSLLAVGKFIIDLVVRSAANHLRHNSAVWWLVALEGTLALLAIMLQRLADLADSLLGDRFTHEINLKLVAHATSLDLASFEEPNFADLMDRARRQAASRIGVVVAVGGMIRRTLSMLSMLAVAAWFLPWILVLLIIAAAPLLMAETKYAWLNYSLLFSQTPERRQIDYTRYLGSSAQSAKEVRCFGLGAHFRQRLVDLFEPLYAANRALAARRTAAGILLSAAPIGVYYAGYAVVVAHALSGSISVGDLVLVGGSLARARLDIQALMSGLASLSEQAVNLKDLFDYFEEKPTIVSTAGARRVPRPPQHGFEFESVGFVYPGGDRLALKDLSFRFGPGESLALVGGNGAGKTTVVKLMLRLYDPSAGRVLLDGVDLKEYDVDDLRRRIGVLFQDYMRYDIPVSMNIGYGDIEHFGDAGRPEAMEAIEAAARLSLAHDMIASLPAGYDQMLGRRFEGGIGLSAGQWQRVALARAYIRDADVLVLDEPCSNLDPAAEFQVYQTFLRQTNGRMSVIISHRFSAVRLAHRILVLDRGQLAEEGSHRELVAHGGRYAALFETQAAAYR